jgi:hemolysin III
VTLLSGKDRAILLWVIWVGALAGVTIRVFWLSAPRWLYVGIYLALGWVAIIYTPQLYQEGGLKILIPLLLGGLFYSVGALSYAFKFPGKNARYFGFHEYFHLFVIAAWISQYVAISIAIYTS